jgi:lipopolysaccharide export system protein LptC
MTAAADQIRTRRRALAAPGSALDKAVRFLAVALPMAVGVIAALMLITPLSPRGEVSFLLDRNKVAVAQDRLRVDDAMYRGQDGRGRPFSLVAGEAVQRSNSQPVVALRDLTARIMLPEGLAELSASAGTYRIDLERVSVPGIVQFAAADGYQIGARNVAIDLPTRVMLGEGRVSGVIPAGSFSANAIRADLAARTLVLAGDANLSMIPGQLRVPSAMR